MKPSERLIISLDLPREQALALVEQTPSGPSFKIGMRLFTSSGPEIVKAVISKGYGVFLDLKFHDIPNTVAEAAESAADLGVSMFNVHASGGPTMMKAARDMLDKWSSKIGKKPPKLLAVTVLTSMDENEMGDVGLPGKPGELVLRWTEMALKSGCDGIVCSAQEVRQLRERFGKDFIAVTPGIRRNADAVGDQKRVATPESAVADGATYIVVGRPIIAATNPAQETLAFIKELENV